MRKLMRVYTAFGYIKLLGALISGVAIFGMMVLIVADVVNRNFLGGSIAGSFEIVQNYFMPLAVFPALAYVYGSGVLPKMDLAMHRFPERAQNGVVYLLLLVELVLLVMLVYYTWGFAMTGMETEMEFVAGGELYPIWPLFFMVPVSFGLVCIETLFVVAKNALGGKVGLAMHEGPEVEAL